VPDARPVDRHRHYAGLAAALFAAAALLGITDWWHYMLSAQSDTMIVALSLAAIDCHLSKRPRWAFVLGALAALGRPEVWPFLALYSIWAWRAMPSMRWLIGSGIVVLLILWFGIPALSSRSPFVAASNAMGSGRRLRSNRVFGTIDRFLDLHETPLELAALLSLIWAALRRDRVLLALAAGGAAWVVVEIAFALHGWPGLGRYMFPAAGVMVVLAAVFVGRLLADLAPLLTVRLRSPGLATAATWVGIALVVALVGSLVPAAISRARLEHRDLHVQRLRTKEINRLAGTVAKLGGSGRLGACGEPLTRLEYQTVLAWTLHVNVARVGFKYSPAIAHGNPIVLFTPRPHGGWVVKAVHQRLPNCRRLPH
jgi:MFS family permease